jgi:hypothetical protein
MIFAKVRGLGGPAGRKTMIDRSHDPPIANPR